MHAVGGVGWAVGLLRENAPDYDSASELVRDVGIGSSHEILMLFYLDVYR